MAGVWEVSTKPNTHIFLGRGSSMMSKESKCSLWCIEFSIVALVMWIDNIMVMIKNHLYHRFVVKL